MEHADVEVWKAAVGAGEAVLEMGYMSGVAKAEEGAAVS